MARMSDSSFLHIENAAHGGAFGNNPLPEPSEAQCLAGNYKVGRLKLYGLPIAIEQPRGTYRTGTNSKTGKRWSCRMAAHYGYINGTRGNDGDAVDCFVGFYPQSQTAYVINQHMGEVFDEHKVMLAFPDEQTARQAYLGSYERGWQGLKSLVPVSLKQLTWWLTNGDMSQPLRAETLPLEGLEAMNRIYWDSQALPHGCTLDHVLYQIRRTDADGLLMDAASLCEIVEDADSVLTLDAMVSPYSKLERKMEVLRGVMERAGGTVKPVAMQITDPFKLRGVANVAAIFELSDGQTVSVYFHNPDVTPNKMAPTDELISWKWLLNKKDITIVVAPERGEDLEVREVARRIMRLAEKNSPAFQRTNGKRAERMQAIQGLKDEIASLETELATAQHELEVAKVEAESRPPAPAPAPAPEPKPDPAATTAPGQLVPDGRESVVKTAKGTEVATGFAVVEADTLITSHDPESGEVNPAFPAELQPRDRGRETSRAWVIKTAASLDPEQLGKTRRADTGAPIVGPDRVVESGNGRTMAIVLAYRTGKAGEYRQWLEDEAGYFGLDAAQVKAMKQPVLVRVRTSDVDRQAFTVEANQDDKLSMTATEKARADAARLTPELIALMTENGDLMAAENVPFLAAFLRSLGDAEAAQYSTSDGKPTSSLIARVQAAIFAKAYSDERLLELTADAAKPEIGNIISALNHAAPEFIQAAALAPEATQSATRQLADSVDVSLNQKAVDAIIGATNVLKAARDSGMKVEEFVKQQGLFGDIDPAVAAMALFVAKNNRSAKRMGSAFKAMATFLKSEAIRQQSADMFGGTVSASFEDIIAAANRELDRQFGEGEFAISLLQPNLFAPTDPVPAPPPEPVPISPAPTPAPTSPVDPAPAPSADPQKDADLALFRAVINGTVADILAPELADQLEAAYLRHPDDPELGTLFEQAVNAYQSAMMAATANLT